MKIRFSSHHKYVTVLKYLNHKLMSNAEDQKPGQASIFRSILLILTLYKRTVYFKH